MINGHKMRVNLREMKGLMPWFNGSNNAPVTIRNNPMHDEQRYEMTPYDMDSFNPSCGTGECTKTTMKQASTRRVSKYGILFLGVADACFIITHIWLLSCLTQTAVVAGGG